MASKAALAKCALVLARLSPTTVPLALLHQCGAYKPEKAGTKYTPPLSGTERARDSVSAAEEIIPSWSRSHWMADPVTATLPSSAYLQQRRYNTEMQ